MTIKDAFSENVIFDEYMKHEKKPVIQRAKEMAFQTERTACAKALRLKRAWLVLGTETADAGAREEWCG